MTKSINPNPLITQDMEQMAIDVLRGNLSAAHALADKLVNDCVDGVIRLPPITHLQTLDFDRYRVMLYLDRGLVLNEGIEFSFDYEGTREAIYNWLRTGTTCTVGGIERMEIYVLPERPKGESTP